MPGEACHGPERIWFPDNALTASEDININAQTIHANGTWTMDIYDDQGDLFTSLSGNVNADGFCVDPVTGNPGVRVSILDGQGNQLPSEYYDIHVAIANGPGTGASSITRRYVERKWDNYRPGKWVVAYQRLYVKDSDGHNDQHAVANMAVDAVYLNGIGGGGYSPYENGAVIGTPPTHGNNSILELQTEPAWSQFLYYIGTSQVNLDVRNLFYFGHCTPPTKRGTIGDYRNPNLCTDAVRLAVRLKNNSLNWDVGAANQHPYRFVFICGCSSAKTDLPLAFGIPKVTMSSAEWTKKYKVPPRAFLGFNRDVPTGGIIGQPPLEMDPALKTFLTNFWTLWAYPDSNGRQRTLKQAVGAAKKAANKGNINTLFGYGISPQIYGCSDLLFDQN